ncbi:MAG: hypothetical protein JWP91_3793, partial [Fibrobacteres bacterium]|nr:hypothetical protein [Fibrobacterota bacterium]
MTNYSDQTPVEAFAESFIDREYSAQTGSNPSLSVSIQTIGD